MQNLGKGGTAYLVADCKFNCIERVAPLTLVLLKAQMYVKIYEHVNCMELYRWVDTFGTLFLYIRGEKGIFLKLCCFQDYNYYSEIYKFSKDNFFHALHLFQGIFTFMVNQKFARLTIYSK